MKQAILVATVFGLCGLGAPALAADRVEETAVAGPSWSGFYVGVHAGAAMGNLKYEQLPPFPVPSTQFAETSLIAGVHLGYDHQFSNRWVGGIEADFTWLGMEDGFNPFTPPLPSLFWANWQASVTGRVGYLVSPQTMLYGRAGLSFIDVKGEEGATDYATGTVTALKLGVGAETFIARNLTARVEASYLHPTDSFTIPADFEAFDPRMLMVTAGLTYRFGADSGSSFAHDGPAFAGWNGFYAGVSGSFSHGSLRMDLDVPFADVGPFGGRQLGLGAFAGYDFQLNERFVAGVEADASWLNLKFDDPMGNSGVFNPPSLFATVRASFIASARIGWLASPSTLLYAKAGFGGLLTEANGDFWPLGEDDSKVLSAYQVGIGTESALTDRLTLRVEGLYTAATSSLTVTNAALDQVSLKPKILTGKVGLAWHF